MECTVNCCLKEDNQIIETNIKAKLTEKLGRWLQSYMIDGAEQMSKTK